MFSLSLSLSLSVIMFAADWRGCFQQYGQKEYFVFYSLFFFFFFFHGAVLLLLLLLLLLLFCIIQRSFCSPRLERYYLIIFFRDREFISIDLKNRVSFKKSRINRGIYLTVKPFCGQKIRV
jgi:hypothetical protein